MSFLGRRIAPSVVKHAYNAQIEQYRGLCALLVLLTHGFADNKLLEVNYQLPFFLRYFNSGYLSVMIFFCISGYVIGITNGKPKLDISAYLKKRAIRLYPVYIIALILCILVTSIIDWKSFLGNLFFLQNDLPYFGLRIPIFVNFPSWSLNYEVFYYLFFIVIFFVRPTIGAFGIFLVLGSALVFFCPPLNFLSWYFNGFYFWALGLLLAWDVFKLRQKLPNSVPFLSLLFLQLCMHHLGIGEIILHIMGVHTSSNINWLFDLPFCMMIMCVLTGKDNRFIRYNKILVYSLPACVFGYLVFHHRITEDTRWIMCLIFWVLSLVFFFEEKVSSLLMTKLTLVGKISYGLYLLHVPIAYIVRKYVLFGNPTEDFLIKYILWISITFGLSILLEMVLQPRLRNYLLSKAKSYSPRLGSKQ